MPDANEVQSALETALADNTADTQTANEPTPEVAEALSSALGAKDETSASDDAADESTEIDGKGQKTVPYERLSQVVRQKNEATERLKALESQFDTARQTEQQLRTRVGEMEQSSQILDAIKNLAQDDKYRDHVVAIDKALQGIEDEVETAEQTGDQKAESSALKKFEAKTTELEEMIADQRAEKLWDEAAGLAKSMLEALPEDYTDEDRAVIGKLWTPRVDWSGIEESGSNAIPSALNTSLADVIKEYGTPRGALVAKTTKDIESRVPEAKLVSDEDAIKGLMEKDWAATDEGGKALMSDEDFSKGMADLLRRTKS
jgi:cell division ATPase FtsA